MSEVTDEHLIKLVKKLDLQQNETMEAMASDPVHGTIEVTGQTIIIHDPSLGGQYATLESLPPINLSVNGQPVLNKIEVRSTDKVEWEVKEPLYEIEVSPDKMEAFFHLQAVKRCAWQLKPKEPSHSLVLEAEKNEDIVLDTIDFTHVLSELQKMSIAKNLDTAAIFQEISNPTFKPILIARGERAREGIDAQLDLYFEEEEKSYYEEVDGKVDYRQHLHIPTVREGDIIARKIPPVEGVFGYNVFGEIIHPQPPKDIVIGAQNHVEIRPNGEVAALKAGRPRMVGSTVKFFDIVTSYVVHGDVNIQTGNILFNGDVIVYGNVMEGMVIEALGSVWVSGNVYGSTITAAGAVTIKGNVIRSRVCSGYYGVLYNRIYHGLRKLDEMLGQLQQAVGLMMEALSSKGQYVETGRILLILINNKFHAIPIESKEIMTLIDSIHLYSGETHQFQGVKSKLVQILHADAIQRMQSLDDIDSIQITAQETIQNISLLHVKNAPIDIRQAQHSELRSTGDIRIRLEGIVTSCLFSEGNIIFYHKDSVCRGGQLEAEGSISAMNIGGEIGGITYVKAGKTILANHISSGRICIGSSCKEIFEPLSHFRAYRKGQRLVIEKQNG